MIFDSAAEGSASLFISASSCWPIKLTLSLAAHLIVIGSVSMIEGFPSSLVSPKTDTKANRPRDREFQWQRVSNFYCQLGIQLIPGRVKARIWNRIHHEAIAIPSWPRVKISIRHPHQPLGQGHRMQLPRSPSQEQLDPLWLRRTRLLPFPRQHTNARRRVSST
jgi:hypothetical protein